MLWLSSALYFDGQDIVDATAKQNAQWYNENVKLPIIVVLINDIEQYFFLVFSLQHALVFIHGCFLLIIDLSLSTSSTSTSLSMSSKTTAVFFFVDKQQPFSSMSLSLLESNDDVLFVIIRKGVYSLGST